MAEKTIIITDLTRFNNPDEVCTAGVDINTGDLIRPMPYLKSKDCKRLNILPGAKLVGDFISESISTRPHTEDTNYKDLKFLGPCTSSDFLNVLENSSFNSVGEGFENSLSSDQKFISPENAPKRSIITISVSPRNVDILPHKFKSGNITLKFTDNSETTFHYMSIRDLGFFDYAQKHHDDNDLNIINDFIKKQDKIYLRIGLGRRWAANDGRDGYWLQCNGIYTFPDYNKDIRSY